MFLLIQTTIASDIKLYNCNTQSTTTVANTNNIEAYPVTQNGYVFYTLINTSRSNQENPINEGFAASGEIKSYNIFSHQTSTVITFTSNECILVVPNSSSASKVILQKLSMSVNGKAVSLISYTIGSTYTTFDQETFGQTNRLLEIYANSCYGNNVFYGIGATASQYNKYLYNLSTQQFTAVDQDSNQKFAPKIASGRCAYIKRDASDGDIDKGYYYDIQ